ncbi:hypothetical protein [Rhodococcus kronopolitis]|uniref:Uncharacterized protein n=1 Tax=Rhodococcus kronopolitis TaxID=1460226 RepID=A0ABV9FVE8_9NOCA
MTHRLIGIVAAAIAFEIQVIVLDLLSKPDNVRVDLNPLNAIGAVAFVVGWLTRLPTAVAVVVAAVVLLVIPFGVYRLSQLWLGRSRQRV